MSDCYAVISGDRVTVLSLLDQQVKSAEVGAPPRWFHEGPTGVTAFPPPRSGERLVKISDVGDIPPKVVGLGE